MRLDDLRAPGLLLCEHLPRIMAAMNISLSASMKSFIEVQSRAVAEIADVLRRFPDGPGHGAETGTPSDAPPDPPGAGED
jgi:hypothetical protein